MIVQSNNIKKNFNKSNELFSICFSRCETSINCYPIYFSLLYFAYFFSPENHKKIVIVLVVTPFSILPIVINGTVYFYLHSFDLLFLPSAEILVCCYDDEEKVIGIYLSIPKKGTHTCTPPLLLYACSFVFFVCLFFLCF